MDLDLALLILEGGPLVAALFFCLGLLRASRSGMLASALVFGATNLARLIIWVSLGYAWDLPAAILGWGQGTEAAA